MEIKLKPIGFVKNNIPAPKREGWEAVTSEIIINDDLKEALSKIDEFSHIIIIYWMHKLSPAQRSITTVHPRGNQDLPLTGVFATHSPARPTPIGITTVQLLECKENVLKVRGLDAIDRTPVLDIKPYIPNHYSTAEIKTPRWVTK